MKVPEFRLSENTYFCAYKPFYGKLRPNIHPILGPKWPILGGTKTAYFAGKRDTIMYPTAVSPVQILIILRTSKLTNRVKHTRNNWYQPITTSYSSP